jgi:hypothetical protein
MHQSLREVELPRGRAAFDLDIPELLPPLLVRATSYQLPATSYQLPAAS